MFGLEIITDTLREETFAPNSFDAITSFQVFEHLPEPTINLRHLYTALRPGGVILIEVPNFETWPMYFLRAHHRHFVQDHLNFFSSKTLGQLLRQTGFTVLQHYYPTRRMSFRHMVNHWGARYMPAGLVQLLRRGLQKSHLWEHSIRLNVGDIVAVIARKA
jgi:predicted SAM-dependent methyltransferase